METIIYIIKKITRRLNIYFHKIRCLILKYKIKHFIDIEGWLSLDEAVALYMTASKLPPNALVVEIGSWKGKSTYCIAKGLKENGIIKAIDPFRSSEEMNIACAKEYEKMENKSILDEFKSNMENSGVLKKIIPMIGFSKEFINDVGGIDFLFIDGDHGIAGCDFDYTNYAPKIKSKGYLAFHDFNQSVRDQGPTWVVNNKVIPSNEYIFVGLFGSLWIAQKK